jgi:hypothetical protein
MFTLRVHIFIMYAYFFFKKNCRYYSHEWISEDPNRVYPHQDRELTDESKMLQKAIS